MKAFNTFTNKQLEALVESVQFNQLERKDMRELCLELLSRVRKLDYRNRTLEMVAGRF